MIMARCERLSRFASDGVCRTDVSGLGIGPGREWVDAENVDFLTSSTSYL